MNPLHPYGGPERRSDVRPLTDDAEVRECRRILCNCARDGERSPEGRRCPVHAILYPTARGADPDWLSEVEVFGTMDEAALARDLELWGESPFELD